MESVSFNTETNLPPTTDLNNDTTSFAMLFLLGSHVTWQHIYILSCLLKENVHDMSCLTALYIRSSITPL